MIYHLFRRNPKRGLHILVIIPENGGTVGGVETEAIVVTLLCRKVDLWPINSDCRW